MTCDSFTLFMAIFYPLVILGLVIDRYFIEPARIGERLARKCKELGRCALCDQEIAGLE